MAVEEVRQLRARLTNEIGVDIVEVMPAGTDKHFEPISFAQQYAGEIAMVFLTAAAMRVLERVKESAKDLGKRLGEAVVKQLMNAISSLTGLDATAKDEAQLEELRRGVDALRVLDRNLGAEVLEEFVAAGRAAAVRSLKERHMPAKKADRIATSLAKEIEHLAAAKRTA